MERGHTTATDARAATRCWWRLLPTAAALGTPLTHGATSASHRIDHGVVDSAGGIAASTSHILASCVGSEIAGSSSSSSHRIEAGCGATALALPKEFPLPPGGGPPNPIPATSDAALLLLGALVVAVAAKRLRSRDRNRRPVA